MGSAQRSRSAGCRFERERGLPASREPAPAAELLGAQVGESGARTTETPRTGDVFSPSSDGAGGVEAQARLDRREAALNEAYLRSIGRLS
ncbi:MAG TPA: hypothetical protein VHR45_09195 [Thermoanaerobaculia bacterium]|nr:hypothetical protein [Thermoanaerobaculia bacterium]